jgi:hypothetical protein
MGGRIGKSVKPEAKARELNAHDPLYKLATGLALSMIFRRAKMRIARAENRARSIQIA